MSASLTQPKKKSINEWVKEVHELSVEKGWHENFIPSWSEQDPVKGQDVPHWRKRSDLETLALVVGELGEAIEEYRKDEPWDRDGVTSKSQECDIDCQVYAHEKGEHHEAVKPEGPSTELVDAVIRIFDYFGEMGWDFERVLQMKHEYNKGRPKRHDKKI